LISCALALLPFRSVTSSYGQLGSKAVAACSAIVPGAPNQRADLPYFKPHSFRMTLAMLGERICPTPEAFKAWSQNLGHEHVLTTFTSYGNVAQLAVHVKADKPKKRERHERRRI
jgi:integrase